MVARWRAVLAALVVLASAGCSADRTEHAASGSGVVIEHQHGRTTIEGRPRRVVTLVPSFTDPALALGAAPVAAPGNPYGRGRPYAWQRGRLDPAKTKLLPVVSAATLNVESIAAQRPDLILAGFVASDKAVYQRLSAIAPTIPMLRRGFTDTWQDVTLVTGRALGREAEARTLVAESERKLRASVAGLPRLKGRTVTFAGLSSPGLVAVVSDPQDAANRLLSALSLSLNPSVRGNLAGNAGVQGQIGMERLRLLDRDLLVIAPFNDGLRTALEKSPQFQELKVVRRGDVAWLNVEQGTALRNPSALNLGYTLDALKPALTRLADR
ncbi:MULTISPECIES: ABC transporter substrate-binding protein [Actinomadura]|uniref:ABC transporter substrate-binding protein n=1 Tax=Actinomadura yumaensis TaxID=111807 RepID=A0ABW2CNM7_9ACTN|nr:ABC transporter substrate-binding protein [Actinomadura sp. J1-007]MWK36869.1 ABC transporter substrate-binding protein [Actinomadura sp. J1-007]